MYSAAINKRGGANLFRDMWTGKLDLQYLRICAVHKLLECGKIGKDRAIELLEQRRVKMARATVEQWLAWPTQRFVN